MTVQQLIQLLATLATLITAITAAYHAFGAKRLAQGLSNQPPVIQPGVPRSSPPPRP